MLVNKASSSWGITSLFSVFFQQFRNSEISNLSWIVNTLIASGFKNSATPFDAILVYNESKFQIGDINIFNGIKPMRFSDDSRMCRLIRNGNYIIIIFHFVCLLRKSWKYFKSLWVVSTVFTCFKTTFWNTFMNHRNNFEIPSSIFAITFLT